jgi:hypothetical protein
MLGVALKVTKDCMVPLLSSLLVMQFSAPQALKLAAENT